MQPKLSFIIYVLFLFSSPIWAQTSINTSTATTALQSTINSVLPGNINVNDFEVNELGAQFTVSGDLPLNGASGMTLSGSFTAAEWNEGEVAISGELQGSTTIGTLLNLLGANAPALPGEFKSANLSNLLVAFSPTDRTMTASFDSNIGKVVIDSDAEGFLFGIVPNTGLLESLTGVNGLMNGFSFVYSSFPNEEDQKTTSSYINDELSIQEVPAKNGLNAYWTGKLPSGLQSSLSFIPLDLDKKMTFSGDGTIGGSPKIPGMSFSFSQTFTQFPLKFDQLKLNLDPVKTSIGLEGNVTCNLGGGIPELGFATAVEATISPAKVEGLLSLNRVGTNSGGVWNSAFGIPGVNLTSLDVTTSASATGGVSGSLGGTAEIFGLTGSLEITSTNSQWGLTAAVEPITIEADGFTVFSIQGIDGEEQSTFTLDGGMKGELKAEIELLGIKSESSIDFTLDGLSCTTTGNLFGVAEATLTMSAGNFTDLENTEFTISGAITQDLTKKIKDVVKDELDDATAILVGAALNTFCIDEIGIEASSKLNDIRNSELTFSVDVELVGFDIPTIKVTLPKINDVMDLALDELVVDIAEEIADELEDAGGDLLGALADFAEEQLNEFGDFAGESSLMVYNAAGAVLNGEDPELPGVAGTVYNGFTNSVGVSTVTIQRAEPKPNDGDLPNGLTPLSTYRLEVTLDNIRVIRNTAPNGYVAISPQKMALNSGANRFLYHKASGDTRGYKNSRTLWVEQKDLSTAKFDINMRFGALETNIPVEIADFLPPTKEGDVSKKPLQFSTDHTAFALTLEWKKNDLGVPAILPNGYYNIQQGPSIYMDAPSDGKIVRNYSAESDDSQLWQLTRESTGMYTIQQVSSGLFLDAHETSNHYTAVLRSAQNNNSQKWFIAQAPNGTFSIRQASTSRYLDIHGIYGEATNISTRNKRSSGAVEERLRWLIKPLVPEILGVGPDHQLYTRTALNSKWRLLPNSGDIVAVSYMNDGSILGVGTDTKLKRRATLFSKWKDIPNAHGFKSAIQLDNGIILGVGIDNKLWKRSSLTGNGQQVRNSGPVEWVTKMKDGRILGANAGRHFTRKSINASWVPIPRQSVGLSAIAQMNDGTLVARGMNDKRLWTKATLDTPWVLLTQENPYGKCIGMATNLTATVK